LYSIERIKHKSYTWFGITQTESHSLNDSASIANGAATTINVLSNDDTKGSPIVTIISDPANGIAVVNVDKTITYTHNGNTATGDSITYQLSNGLCATSAKINIIIAVSQTPTAPVMTTYSYEGIYDRYDTCIQTEVV
jgi:hypothetical protein